MSPENAASPKGTTRPPSVKIQYPRPLGVADRLVTFSPSDRWVGVTPPKPAASPNVDTPPAESTTQYPAPDGVGSTCTAVAPAPRRPTASPYVPADPKGYTAP